MGETRRGAPTNVDALIRLPKGIAKRDIEGVVHSHPWIWKKIHSERTEMMAIRRGKGPLVREIGICVLLGHHHTEDVKRYEVEV